MPGGKPHALLVTLRDARKAFAVLMRQLDEAAQRKLRMVQITGTRDFEQPGSGPRVAPYVLVLAALVVVLLLGCANVGNLQLARAMANERDEYQRLRRRAKQFIDATAAATIRFPRTRRCSAR